MLHSISEVKSAKIEIFKIFRLQTVVSAFLSNKVLFYILQINEPCLWWNTLIIILYMKLLEYLGIKKLILKRQTSMCCE